MILDVSIHFETECTILSNFFFKLAISDIFHKSGKLLKASIVLKNIMAISWSSFTTFQSLIVKVEIFVFIIFSFLYQLSLPG